jgi:uncharacterized protein (TIGR02246 family)
VLLSAELPRFVRSNPPSSTSSATGAPLSPEARQFFLTGEPEFADRYFPWLVNIMSPAYWIYFVMAATALFSGLKGLSRFRLWRIDAAREKLEAEVRQIAGDVVSYAPIHDLSTRGLMVDQERRAAAQDILDRLAKLRSRCQHHAKAFSTPMGDEMLFRYQQSLIDDCPFEDAGLGSKASELMCGSFGLLGLCGLCWDRLLFQSVTITAAEKIWPYVCCWGPWRTSVEQASASHFGTSRHSHSRPLNDRSWSKSGCGRHNKGDAHAFSAKCTEDVSFTNIAGTSHYGRAAFEQRHAELFAGIFKGSIRTQSIEKLRFLREDVAVADVKMELRGYTRLPPGIQSGSDGVHRTSLQLVLTKEQDCWRIAAFHNVTIPARSPSVKCRPASHQLLVPTSSHSSNCRRRTRPATSALRASGLTAGLRRD